MISYTLTRPTKGRRIFGCLSVALWLTFGSLLAPFGSLFAPFWLPLAPFGSLLAPLGSHFCSLWLTFCSFWLTFTHLGGPFSHFGRLLASFLVPFLYFRRKSDEKSCFSMFFLKFSTFYAPASAKHPQTNRGSPFTERFPSFAQLPLPPGPERNLAVGNLDPLRARVGPRRVWIWSVCSLPCMSPFL